MKKFFLLLLTLILTGCGNAEREVTEPIITVPEVTVAELVQISEENTEPETTETEAVDETVWLPPYYTDKGKLEFHCLVKNETMGDLSVVSMKTEYYLDDEVIQTKHYDKKELKKFLWRPFNELDLSLAASTLLIVDDYPAKDGFDHAVVAITVRDDLGQETVLNYNFTMDETEVTPSTLTDNWELSTSWLVDIGGWNWDHMPRNDTEDTLKLECSHHIHYDDGIPVAVEKRSLSQFNSFVQTIDELDPGTSAPYTTGVKDEVRNFNQREVVFVYRNDRGEPYLQTFYFIYEEALSWEEYNVMPKGVNILSADETIAALGGRQYSKAEIQEMINDNLPLDEVAEKISTVGDLFGYLNLKGFAYALRGDDKFWSNGQSWQVPPSAYTVFEQNTADCLSGSNLLNYILRNDYDEQGYVQETALTNGHVFNWFRQGDMYYFVDWTVVDLQSDFDNMAFVSYSAEDPQDYSNYYIEKSKIDETSLYIIRLQYMYPREGDQLPIRIVRDQKPFYRVLPTELEESVTLLYEDSENYTLEFQPGPPEENWPSAARNP